ncbi:hypothetical protein TSAR_010194 [Trichomalopsis sarcophagae]|uniref:Uncharacterized protein n=1 Tax=Trichomalopsis sarcophagae TaxID=543379 RepID=A0A232EX17_9HYME|nr:hypothetical protein TSAR_010194 [Trichomalopsis sarcophagae]
MLSFQSTDINQVVRNPKGHKMFADVEHAVVDSLDSYSVVVMIHASTCVESWQGRVPPDKHPAFVECHTGKRVETAVCIIRDKAFHILEKHLIICPEHSDNNITSKIDEKNLHVSTRILIAQIKSKTSEELKKRIIS